MERIEGGVMGEAGGRGEGRGEGEGRRGGGGFSPSCQLRVQCVLLTAIPHLGNQNRISWLGWSDF